MNRTKEFVSVFRERISANPKGPAVFFKNTITTNLELQKELEGLRTELGPLNGCRTMLLLPDSFAAYAFYLHLFLEKAVVVPLSTLLAGERIGDLCRRTNADLVITNEFLFKAHQRYLSQYRCLIVENPESATTALSYHFAGAKLPLRRSDRVEPVRMIIFTSGSTGIPKGVCLSEDNILSAARMMVEFLPLTSETVSMITVPLYDYYGMIQIFGHILGDGTFNFGLTSVFRSALFSGMKNTSCTDLVLVPHTLRALLEVSDAVAPTLRSIQRITSSSDYLCPEILRQLFDIAPQVVVVNIYGLTEAGRACYRKISKDSPYSRSIGRPSPGVLIVADGTKDQPGEIIIRGPNVMLGYLECTDEDGITYRPYSEMRTGDLGYVDEDGEIVLLGRRDHMINLMGMKIHPDEIEAAALQVQGITDARAVVDTRQDGTKTIGLEIVLSSNTELKASEIVEHMRSKLPRPLVPAHVDFVAKIGRTDIGSKILR